MESLSLRVFLSFAASDKSRAEAMANILQSNQIEVLTMTPSGRMSDEDMLATIRDVMAKATMTFVLIGPRTRASKWVDKEIEIALLGTKDRPPTGLVAVILPEHEDFSRPFYDPENVPLRIHDHVSRESAILRKWSENPDEIRKWIADADQRRRRFPVPLVSFATQSALRRFDWDASADES